MKRKLLLLSVLLLCVATQAQRFQYYSLSFYGQGSALSNYRTLPIQPQAYYSGGFDYGISYTQTLNLKIGVHYLSTYINNDKLFHSICDQPDNTCFAESVVQYINIPLGIELYSNGARLKTKSYSTFRLIPMFSFSETLIKSEIYTDPEVFLGVDSSVNTGLKFQDLHFEIVLGTDFSITRKLKLYFEPSIQHSILFRREDLINPNYLISLRVGLRVRSYKR